MRVDVLLDPTAPMTTVQRMLSVTFTISMTHHTQGTQPADRRTWQRLRSTPESS